MAPAKYVFHRSPPLFVFMSTSNGARLNRHQIRKFFELCKWRCELLCEEVEGKQKRQRGQSRQKTPFCLLCPFCLFFLRPRYGSPIRRLDDLVAEGADHRTPSHSNQI